jgi:hypothetical protein
MIGEINMGGVFIPSLVIWVIISLILLFIIRRKLIHCGFYRRVWHQSLFNFSLFAIILGIIVSLVDLF